jgi:hypothetical protein
LLSPQFDEGVPLHLFELGGSRTKGRHPAKRSGGGAVPQRRGEPGVQGACPLPEADFLSSSTRSDPRSTASSAHRLATRQAATSHSLPNGVQDVSPARIACPGTRRTGPMLRNRGLGLRRRVIIEINKRYAEHSYNIKKVPGIVEILLH